MFDVAPTELLLVVVVALLVIGPKDLPKAMRFVGKWVGKARGMARHFRSGLDTMMREAELEELEKQYPHLRQTTSSHKQLRPEHPMEPIFRVGQLSIGYHEEDDMIWIIAKALVINDVGEVADLDSDEIPAIRFVATRDQMRAMSEHALEVISQGRPVCPLCGRPIDRNGHFCARTDGKAMPIVF